MTINFVLRVEKAASVLDMGVVYPKEVSTGLR
jgi:hypothetical protein